MLPLTLAVGLIWALKDYNLLNTAAPIIQSAHQACVNHIGEHSAWSHLYQALSCGSKIYGSNEARLFRELGVVHLFVFSGAHLVFAERLCLRFIKSHFITFAVLSGLCAMSGLNPPAVRALVNWALNFVNQKAELNWSNSLTVGLSGLICLAINPSWWQGLSLPLSWVATLSFTNKDGTEIQKSARVYFLSLPLLIMLGPASPLAIIINTAISPLFFGLLLPMSWLAGAIPFLQRITDPLWTTFIDLLNTISMPIHFELKSSVYFTSMNWVYVFMVQAYFYLKARKA